MLPKKRDLGMGILIISLLTSYFPLLASQQVWAKSKQEELKGYNERIREEKRRIKKVEKKERSALSELESIEKTLKEKEEELKIYDLRLRDTESKLRIVERDLGVLNRRMEEEKINLKGRLRAAYKQNRSGYYYGILIGSKNSEDLFKRYKYLKATAEQNRRIIEHYMEDSINLNKNMIALERLGKEVSAYSEKIKGKEKEIKAEKGKKLLFLSSLRTEKSAHERLLQELEEAARHLESLIKEADKGAAITPPSGIGFSAQKGRLPWPNEGKLMALFGKQRDPEFNTPVFKRGIEIQAPPGDDIKAVYGGSVVYSDWFKGYGKMLIINHGERYYSLYAHASEIFPKVGETVSAGQVIGKAGDTGSFKGPILYFEIRYKGEPVDPLSWLRKR